MGDYVLKGQIDCYIREHYKDDIKSLNGIMCLFKTNSNNIEKIKNIEDFEVKFKQANGYQSELLKIINKLKKEFNL